jgi:hypothetical protein
METSSEIFHPGYLLLKLRKKLISILSWISEGCVATMEKKCLL